MKRRDILKALPLGFAAAALPVSIGGLGGRAFGRNALLSALTNESGNTDRILVLINLQGGNDGLNTIIPFTDPLYASSRKNIGFTTTAEQNALKALTLSSAVQRPDLAFNPNMDNAGTESKPSFVKMWKDGKLAVVQNVGYAEPNLSHFRSTDIWNSASDSNVLLTTGWVGRYLEHDFPNYPLGVQPGDDPIALEIGSVLNNVFQGTRSGMGLAVNDPAKYNAAEFYAEDNIPANHAGAELDYVRNILVQSDSYGDRFKTLFASNPKNKIAYPAGNRLAAQLAKVALCISLGMKTRVYFVSQGGYDTHSGQNSKDKGATGQGQLLNQLAEAIAYFQSDLEAMGVADKVVGMTYSEFGRRVTENDSNGTDHGTCAPQLVFGTQVNGEVYGNSPNLSDLDNNGDLKWQIDFRQLYTALLGDWFGLDASLRKSILMDTTGGDRFAWNTVKINGTSNSQSLVKPAEPRSVASVGATDFQLSQNYPNPFNPSTTIEFALASRQRVRLEVYNTRGERVAELLNAELSRGEHRAVFEAAGLPSGTYFYRLESDRSVITKQMSLVK